MRLVVVGDVHHYDLDVPWSRLFCRRAFAHTNLRLNRHRRFAHERLPEMVAQIRALRPGLVLFSGDVSTSSLVGEFARFRDTFAPLLAETPGVLVPGNHDRYTFGSRRTRRIETELAGVVPDAFPHVRALRPGWRLLALDSARPNLWTSRGELGADQLAAARRVIAEVPADEGLVVLCHYPCTLPPKTAHAWSHDLKEEAALRDALVRCPGRVLYVHGHIHRPWHVPAATDGRPAVECLNAGAPCLTSTRYPGGQGFWELTLPENPRAPLNPVHHRLT